jgi:hypothetical protein
MIQKRHNPYPLLAEMIRKQGRNGDTVLAHINPIEAQILKSLGGSGRINPKTGIPEFGGIFDFIANPAKMLKKTFRNPKSIARGAGDLLSVAGALFGGPAGSALAGAARSAIRKENPLQGALKGGMYGTLAPMAANLAGQGLSALGTNTLGSSLQNYATNNMGSWFGNIAQAGEGIRGLGLPFTGSNSSSMLGKGSRLAALMSLGGGAKGQIPAGYSGLGVGAGSDAATAEDLSFMDKLLSKSSDYLSDPANLLTLGVVGSSFMNRPKKETPEKLARDEKAYLKALMLTPEELRQKESQDLALAQMKRRIERNKFLPEERFAIEPLYVKSNTPEEYKRKGQWLNYYNNPDFSGEPLVMRKGGSVNLPTQRTNLKNKFTPKERFFNETLDFLPKKRFTIKPLVKKKGGLASFIV